MNIEEFKKLLNEVEVEKSKNRYFEKVSFEEFKKGILANFKEEFSEEKLKEMYEDLPYPCRSTKSSGGYDFYTPYDFILEPGETRVIPSGFRVHMNNDEIFNLFIRSGTGFKYNVRLSNQVGVIDADYYNNSNNEGQMFFSFTNHGSKQWINKSYKLPVSDKSKMGQGIFMPYYKTYNDNFIDAKRNGGFGSTNK